MQDSAKYLIHADITTDGVVERSDVVGAIFGQTEGLLGSDLDLRDLQQSSKVGRIDVDIRSENGQSFGEVTIASGLDKVETAILAAALETIDRVGPCKSQLRVDRLEDVRAAKRREIVERATDLLAAFEREETSSQDLVEEVRRQVRVADITEYQGLPAGPRVADSDAIVVVEGRADVLQLLKYGVKNAIAVEGTDVPEAVAALTRDRTVTAFLDGDRGGDLILEELRQVGTLDSVAFAPAGKSVEDLSRGEIMSALREKVPVEVIADDNTPHESVAATDGSSRPAPPETGADTASPETPTEPDPPDQSPESTPEPPDTEAETTSDDTDVTPEKPETLPGHVHAVIGAGSGQVVCLDSEFAEIERASVDAAFETVADAEPVPATVIIDGELTQRVLDVAAQRGVEQIVAGTQGEFVKKPTSVRVRTADQFDLE